MFQARVSYNQEGVMIGIVVNDKDTDIDYWYEAQDIVNILSDQIRQNGKQIKVYTKKGAKRNKNKMGVYCKSKEIKGTSRDRLPACKTRKEKVQSKATRGRPKKAK